MTSEQHAKAIEDAALRAAIRAGVGAAPAPPDVVAELEEVKTVCAQAYQVMGVLLSDAGRLDSPEAVKILDNLAEQRLRHTDVLPWAAQAAPQGWRDISTAPKDESPMLLGYLPHPKLDRRVFEGRWCESQQTWTSVNGYLVHNDATHWMPLPPAPQPNDSAPL